MTEHFLTNTEQVGFVITGALKEYLSIDPGHWGAHIHETT